MSLDIRLSMDDMALAPFRDAWTRAVSTAGLSRQVASAARRHHAEIDPSQVPTYLQGHIALIPEIADLLGAEDWQLDDDVRDGLAGALTYFSDPSDLIPDMRPNFGLLDDAIVLEMALAQHRQDWSAWQEYSAVRHSLPPLGRLDRWRWAELRVELPRLLRKGDGSFLHSRFGWNNGRSEYRLLADLPRFDML